MDSILLISILFASIVSIDCQSKHFCQALKDNKWKISYGLSVPNGTFMRKFIIIKDHFWELEYDPSIPNRNKRQDSEVTTGTPFLKGPVFLKNVWSKQSSWLSGEYHTAFGMRYGMGTDKDWKQVQIGLVNLKAQKVEWSLFDRNFKDLTETPKKKTLDTGFADYKPDIAYNTYGRQEVHTIVFVEQKKNPVSAKRRYLPIIQAFNSTDLDTGLQNETDSNWFRNPKPRGGNSTTNRDQEPEVKRYIVPDYLQEVAEFYNIRGLFGVKLSNKDNGSIVLIEHCPDENWKPSQSCSADPYLVYCVVMELDDDPMRPGRCLPATTIMTTLTDCSNPNEWTTPPDTNATQPPSESQPDAETRPPDAATTPSSGSDNESGGEKGGGWIWIVIVIVIIVIIIVIIILVLLCCCKKKGETPNEGKTDEEQPQSTPPTEKSQSLGTVSAMGSTRSNFEKSSGDPSKNKSLSKTSSQPSGTSDTGPTTKLVAPSQAGPNSMSMPSVRSKMK